MSAPRSSGPNGPSAQSLSPNEARREFARAVAADIIDEMIGTVIPAAVQLGCCPGALAQDILATALASMIVQASQCCGTIQDRKNEILANINTIVDAQRIAEAGRRKGGSNPAPTHRGPSTPN